MSLHSRISVCLALAWLAPGLAPGQVELEVTANPDPARNGEMIEVLLQVSNASAVSQLNLVVELDYPAGVNNLSETLISDGGGCIASACEVGEVISWTLPALAPGQGIRLSLPPIVATATLDGTVIPFAGRLLQGAITVGLDSATVLVSAAPVLDLGLDASASPVAAGGAIDYTLSFGNEGAATLTDLTLRLPLPSGVTLDSASDSGTLVGDDVEWSIAILEPGLGSTRRVRVTVDPLASGSLVRASGAEISGSTPGVSARASVVTRVVAGSPLALVAIATPDPVKRLEDMEVELTVSNVGAATLFDVVAQVRVPVGVTPGALTFHTSGATCPTGSCEIAEFVTWPVGSLLPGQAVTVVFAPELASTAVLGSVVEFRAQARATGGASAEAYASALARATPSLDLALLVDRDPVVPTEVLTYTLVFGNESALTLVDAVLELPLPSGTQFLSGSDGGTSDGERVTWPIGTLAPRSGDRRRLRVSVDPATAGTLLVGPAASLRVPGAPFDDARASASTRVAASAPLRARLAANPDPARELEATNLELVVANVGVDPILNTSVELRMPFEVSSLSETTTAIENGGDCAATTCEAREILTWLLGTLQPGEARTLAVTPAIANTAVTTGGQVFSVAADVRTSGALAASASAALLIDDAPALDLALEPGRDPAVPGQPLDLVLGFGNESALSRTLRLELPLPEGATLLSASNGGKLVDGVVTWDINAVPTQQGGRRSVRLQLGAGSGLLDLLPARIFDLASPLDAARASAVLQLEALPPLTLSAAATPDPAPRSSLLDVDFEARNQGAIQLFNVVAQVRLPAAINSFSDTLLVPAGGDCPATGCEAGELATWALGQLNPGAVQPLSLPPSVTASAVLGSHLRFRARVFDPDGRDVVARRLVRVGASVDTDGDAVQQLDDNCPVFANPGQEDADLDGRGDACECGDQNLDGRNTVSDLVAINLAIFNPGQVTVLCDATNDGLCNVNDIIAANVEIFSPTSTSICARQPVPGP